MAGYYGDGALKADDLAASLERDADRLISVAARPDRDQRLTVVTRPEARVEIAVRVIAGDRDVVAPRAAVRFTDRDDLPVGVDPHGLDVLVGSAERGVDLAVVVRPKARVESAVAVEPGEPEVILSRTRRCAASHKDLATGLDHDRGGELELSRVDPAHRRDATRTEALVEAGLCGRGRQHPRQSDHRDTAACPWVAPQLRGHHGWKSPRRNRLRPSPFRRRFSGRTPILPKIAHGVLSPARPCPARQRVALVGMGQQAPGTALRGCGCPRDTLSQRGTKTARLTFASR